MSALVFAWMQWASTHMLPLVQALGGMAVGAAVFGVVLALLDRDLVRNARRHFLPRTA